MNGGTLNVKNLDVKADSQQGLSNLNIAVGVGFIASQTQIFAAASGDDVVRNQLDGTTTAKIENATINHDGNINVNAYLKDNVFATNIAASDVNITARDDHKSNKTVVSAALSTGLAVSVNRMSTSINSGLANLNEKQLGNALSANDLTMKPSNASKENATSDSDKLTGEYASETRFLNEDFVNSLLNGVRANSTATKQSITDTLRNSRSKSYILDAGLKIVGYTGVFAYNTNTAQTGIEISNKAALSAKNINLTTQNQTYRATDTLAISAGNTFTAENLTFNALNGGQTYAHTNRQAYLGLNAVVAKGLAHTNSNASISIADANTFKAATVNITAQIGEENKYTAEATGFAINGSAVGINIDDAKDLNIYAGADINGEGSRVHSYARARLARKYSRNKFTMG